MGQKTWMAAVWVLALAGALSACGGGGPETMSVPKAAAVPASGTQADATLVLAAPAAVEGSHHIALAWTASAEFTSFSVWLAASGSGEFAPIATDLPGSRRSAEVDRGAAWKLDFPGARIRVRGCDAEARCTDSNEQPLLETLMGSVLTVAGLNEPSPSGFSFKTQSKARLSTDGNTLAVQRGNSRDRQLWVYHRGPDGRWQPEAALDLPLPGDNPMLYGELRLSGDGGTAVIRINDDAQGLRPVFVFARDDMRRWSRQAVLAPDAPLPDEPFGQQLAISEDGDLIAASGSHRVLVFARDGTGQWRQDSLVTEPAASATPLQAELGLALSANGKFIAVTAYGGVNTGIGASGTFYSVRVYRRDCKCHRWNQQADLHSERWPYPEDTYAVADNFGQGGIEFDGAGRRLVVGAKWWAANPQSGFMWGLPGAVYVFDADGTGWHPSARITSRDRPYVDDLGSDLSLSRDGKLLAAGTCGYFSADAQNRNHPAGWDNSRIDDDPNTVEWRCTNRAAAYIYTADDQGAWTFKTAVVPNNQRDPESSDTQRFNVAISGDGQTFLFNWEEGYRQVPEGAIQHGGVVVY
jgi:hypothetical protein